MSIVNRLCFLRWRFIEHVVFLNDQRHVFEGTPSEAAKAVDPIFCSPRRHA